MRSSPGAGDLAGILGVEVMKDGAVYFLTEVGSTFPIKVGSAAPKALIRRIDLESSCTPQGLEVHVSFSVEDIRKVALEKSIHRILEHQWVGGPHLGNFSSMSTRWKTGGRRYVVRNDAKEWFATTVEKTLADSEVAETLHRFGSAPTFHEPAVRGLANHRHLSLGMKASNTKRGISPLVYVFAEDSPTECRPYSLVRASAYHPAICERSYSTGNPRPIRTAAIFAFTGVLPVDLEGWLSRNVGEFQTKLLPTGWLHLPPEKIITIMKALPGSRLLKERTHSAFLAGGRFDCFFN